MASPFLALPAEIRNEIYQYALEWPDFEILARKLESQLKTQEHPYEPKYMTTPTLLLLNRQTYNDAREMPFEFELVIDEPLPFNERINRSISITDVICKTTLQKLRFVKLRVELDYDQITMANSAKCWLDLVKDLFEIWDERNSIERLELVTHCVSHSRIREYSFEEAAHCRCALDVLSRLRSYKNVPVVYIRWHMTKYIKNGLRRRCPKER